MSIRRSVLRSCGLMVAALPFVSMASSAQTVQLSPGDDVQAAVTAAAAGTTFSLAAGVYRLQSVQPKAGDIFVGKKGVIFNGSQVLTFQPDPAGSGLFVASATAIAGPSGTCSTAYPLCGYDQDLFIDSKLQTPAVASAGLPAGSWFFDRLNSNVYVPSDPTGHTVELGMKPYAFYGNASNVQIKNLVVEKYAAQAQTGAVGGDTWVDGLGSGWIVNNVEARWNHGAGIVLGDGSQILNSYIHHNGQIGIKFLGTGCTASSNEISWNNYANYSAAWEAGGSKFSTTTNLVVQGNYVHDNNGPGLWTDINNVGTLYQKNIITNNVGSGIVHEISYTGTIKNNVVKGNGNNATVWLWNSQILVMNSSNTQIFGNTVEVPANGGNGIGLISQSRGTGTQGPWVTANNSVHNNVIVYTGGKGQSGIVDSAADGTAVGNHFDYNQYILASGTFHWNWFASLTWSGFQAAGQEANGTCCAVGAVPNPSAAAAAVAAKKKK